jgi:hypothetical protein
MSTRSSTGIRSRWQVTEKGRLRLLRVRIARHGFAAYMLGTSPEYYSAKVPTKRLRRASYFALKQHSTGKLRIHDVKR